MPEIRDAEQATLITLEFLERVGYPYRGGQKAERSDTGWKVEVLVGAFKDKTAKVELASDGEIKAFEVVPSKQPR